MAGEEKKEEKGEISLKISQETLNKVSKLPKEKRERVEEIAREHIRTCRRMDVPMESMDRLYVEAMEMVALGLDDGDEKWDEYTAPQRYHQYTAPTHGFGL